MKHIAYLDGWRGMAVIGVMLGHFAPIPGINLGRFGVELFFVLSGRLMAEILFVQEKPLPNFYLRRFARIYPALLVFITVVFGIAAWRGSEPTVGHTIAALTLTANYMNPLIGRTAVFDHIWSLCIEEHMYLVLGLVAFIHRQKTLPLVPLFCILAAAAMLNGLLQTSLGGNYYSVYWRTDVRGASLLLGVIAYLVLRGRSAPPWVSPALFAVALLLSFNAVPDPLKYSLGSLCLASSLVTMGSAPGRLVAAFQHPLAMRAGLYSYSLYLWQQPFAKLDVGLLGHLALLPIVCFVAAISYYFIEQPTRRHLNNWIARVHPKREIARTT